MCDVDNVFIYVFTSICLQYNACNNYISCKIFIF